MSNRYDLGQVYIICDKTDMKKCIDTLGYLIKEKFEPGPFSDKDFLFCSGKQSSFKDLYWEGQGYWFLYKKFENGKMN